MNQYKTPRNNVYQLNKQFIDETPFLNKQNRSIIYSEGIKSNWEYREFIQNNAVSLMKIEFEKNCGKYISSNPVPVEQSNIKQKYLERKRNISKLTCTEIPV
tara:strand:- start:753 stop:1058 length:306 start_codon:yes stop_codon:yes gene_type:complete